VGNQGTGSQGLFAVDRRKLAGLETAAGYGPRQRFIRMALDSDTDSTTDTDKTGFSHEFCEALPEHLLQLEKALNGPFTDLLKGLGGVLNRPFPIDGDAAGLLVV